MDIRKLNNDDFVKYNKICNILKNLILKNYINNKQLNKTIK